jgi:hypothetical protein
MECTSLQLKHLKLFHPPCDLVSRTPGPDRQFCHRARYQTTPGNYTRALADRNLRQSCCGAACARPRNRKRTEKQCETASSNHVPTPSTLPSNRRSRPLPGLIPSLAHATARSFARSPATSLPKLLADWRPPCWSTVPDSQLKRRPPPLEPTAPVLLQGITVALISIIKV